MNKLRLGERLHLYGDSISLGVTYDQTKEKYTRLKRSFAWHIDEAWGGIFRNYSKMGDTLSQSINRIKLSLSQKKPTVAMFEFGGNDSDFCWEEVAQSPWEYHCPKTPIDMFIKLFIDCVTHMKALGIEPILLIPPPIVPSRYLRWICQNNQIIKRRILRWLGDAEKLTELHDNYCKAVGGIANCFELLQIDLRKAFQRRRRYQDCFCIDGIHPNMKGHKIMGLYILKHLRAHV